jgi:hypothetical protein
MVGQPSLASTLSLNQTHQHCQVHHQASTQTMITKKPNKPGASTIRGTTKPIKIYTITIIKLSEELTPTFNSTKSWLKKIKRSNHNSQPVQPFTHQHNSCVSSTDAIS